jgi:hypothetical protein
MHRRNVFPGLGATAAVGTGLHLVGRGPDYADAVPSVSPCRRRYAFLNRPVARFCPQLAALLGIGGQRPDLVVRFAVVPTCLLPCGARSPR